MALANVGSRRACEDLIRQGRVKVNGKVIQLGDQADPQTDVIELDGTKLAFPNKLVYIALNKPKNVVSSNVRFRDDSRQTVRELIPHEGHLFTIGRLDADSEGLIILTNDGDMANQLSHPSYLHSKTYKVVVYGLPTQETLERWQKGVVIQNEENGESYQTAPCSVKIVTGGKETTLRIVMTEGKKRQIRQVASMLGHPVKSLLRTHVGKLPLGELRSGEWRELNAKDLEALKAPADEMRDIKALRKAVPRRRIQRKSEETAKPSPSGGRRPPRAGAGSKRPDRRRGKK